MNKTKRRIFNTAVKLFAEKGYDNTNIEEITAIAGVAKGSLYYHFSKKEDIFNLILDEGEKLLVNSIEIKTRNCKNSLDKIKEIIMIQIKIMINYEDFYNTVLSQAWGKEEKNEKCKHVIHRYIIELEKVIEEGIKKGEIVDGDVKDFASSIFGSICAIVFYRQKMNREIDIDKMHQELIQVAIKILKKI